MDCEGAEHPEAGSPLAEGGAMAHREYFLQIEPVSAYSPLAPIRCARHYGRDCMRSPGHEIGRVTPEEIFGSTFDAMVYRRYHDAAYTMPVTDPLVAADVNEHAWDGLGAGPRAFRASRG